MLRQAHFRKIFLGKYKNIFKIFYRFAIPTLAPTHLQGA